MGGKSSYPGPRVTFDLMQYGARRIFVGDGPPGGDIDGALTGRRKRGQRGSGHHLEGQPCLPDGGAHERQERAGRRRVAFRDRTGASRGGIRKPEGAKLRRRVRFCPTRRSKTLCGDTGQLGCARRGAQGGFENQLADSGEIERGDAPGGLACQSALSGIEGAPQVVVVIARVCPPGCGLTSCPKVGHQPLALAARVERSQHGEHPDVASRCENEPFDRN